ncbi:putative coiled-coil domain-containing protein 195 [Hyperolius riggenbachi]|uniref:putative coiled-coil domain-containing protein 195 n=1 Tax=Hyperolius riggenbachi TaxID=752182 RepID=UPI0035A33F69
MEGDTHLVQLIREMRSEINKLEKENKELRGELSQIGHRIVSARGREIRTAAGECELQQGEEVMCKGVLRRNVSAGSTNILQEQTGAKMTVRRYSMSSLLSGSGYHKYTGHIKSHASNGTLRMSGHVPETEFDPEQNLAKQQQTATEMPPELLASNLPKTRSFQDYIQKCRGRVKAVTFLLPMDTSSYTENQMTFQNAENQSTNHLSTIIEKDP